MNKEVIKAINKSYTKETFFTKSRKWWNKNDYKVYRVIFFPIWLFILTKEWLTKTLNKTQVWSEERAKQIFDYYIPRNAEWDDEKKSFYFFDNGYGWQYSLAKKFLKRKDRRFWKCHNGWGGGKLRRYLIETYELDGFIKKVGDCSDGWTEIIFILKQEKGIINK